MGVFIPLDYDISRITNATEVRVVENLRDRLSDSWHIIPNLDIAKENRPYEIDVLLIHKEYGLIALEVKGGPVTVRQGQWSRRNITFDVAPPKQAQNAAYALRDELRESDSSLQHIHVAHGLVLPDVTSVSHDDIIDIERKQLFLRDDIENCKDKIVDLALMSHKSQALSDIQATAIIEKVRPDIDFIWDPQSQARNARISLDRIMREQTRALATLDHNQNVFVQGSAGTGKTKLALQWARRAVARGDSTMITCFNIPLGHYISKQFGETDTLYAGYFEDIIGMLPGLPSPPPQPEDLTQLENYYGLTLPRHVLQNIDKIDIRFDTIIVDEIQDFHAMWVHVLLALLRPDGPRRFLTVGDERQNLHGREGVQAVLSFRPTRAELLTNCRNAQRIGELLHSMGGAEVASASPEGEIFVIEANTLEDAVSSAIAEVQTMLHSEVWDSERILIATIGKNERQALLTASDENIRFVAYEDSTPGAITCETVHRAKGLEYDAVVLIATREDIRDQLVYVGASRAVTRLVIVGPNALFERLGIM